MLDSLGKKNHQILEEEKKREKKKDKFSDIIIDIVTF
jgi:hypothetical protein